MHKVLIDLMMAGYDIHFASLKTISGLHHPDSKDYVEVILLKRLPGIHRRRMQHVRGYALRQIVGRRPACQRLPYL